MAQKLKRPSLRPFLNGLRLAVEVVALIVFAEDAQFVGFVLPGETAATLGGVAAKLGHLPLWAVLVTVIAAAIVGDKLGQQVGRHSGRRLLGCRSCRSSVAVWTTPRRS
jgi:membrane protein DedA with SNARE-associated domain